MYPNSRCKPCRVLSTRAARSRDVESARAKERARYAKDLERSRTVKQAWRSENSSKVIGYTNKRRALKAATQVEPVDYDEIRAAFVDCYLCGHELSGDIHMDHVVPLSRGGAHSADNLRPTHAGCNLRKNDRLLSELKWYPPVG